jgi:putative effector of murein hydrolase LrgA (UPF0299 family)
VKTIVVVNHMSTFDLIRILAASATGTALVLLTVALSKRKIIPRKACRHCGSKDLRPLEDYHKNGVICGKCWRRQ